MIPDYFTHPADEKPEQHLEETFRLLAYWQQGVALSQFRVSVKKGKLTATFGLNAARAPYFFADRDITINEHGTTQRIFHFVRPHQRANGQYVRAHHRGLRQFKWAGYDVLITVPELHHFALETFNLGAVDEEWRDKPEYKRWITTPEMAQRLADHIEGKPLEVTHGKS